MLVPLAGIKLTLTMLNAARPITPTAMFLHTSLDETRFKQFADASNCMSAKGTCPVPDMYFESRSYAVGRSLLFPQPLGLSSFQSSIARCLSTFPSLSSSDSSAADVKAAAASRCCACCIFCISTNPCKKHPVHSSNFGCMQTKEAQLV